MYGRKALNGPSLCHAVPDRYTSSLKLRDFQPSEGSLIEDHDVGRNLELVSRSDTDTDIALDTGQLAEQTLP